MDLLNSSVLSVVIGVAATILALSVLVQVLQEIWKFVTSSRARCYTKVLVDFLGPWATRMVRPGVLPEFQARGPFQFRRLGPTGVLLPLGKPELVEGLERTVPPLIRRALTALRTETELQDGKPGHLSSEWARFVADLAVARKENSIVAGPESRNLEEIEDFILSNRLPVDGVWDVPVDAARALAAFRSRFLSHVVDAERHFGRLDQLFEYSWRRRNLRQTFILGVAVAFLAAQPMNRIFENARRLSAEQALAIAEAAMYAYSAQEEMFAPDTEGGPSTTQPLTREQLDQALNESLAALDQAGVSEFNGWNVFWGVDDETRNWGHRTRYFLWCLLTGALVSFGAPFWNDLLGVLVRIRRGQVVGAASGNSPHLAGKTDA